MELAAIGAPTRRMTTAYAGCLRVAKGREQTFTIWKAGVKSGHG